MASREFDRYRPEIKRAAGVLYRARREGEEPDAQASRVHIEPITSTTDRALRRAEIKEARINGAAKSIARLAALADDIDRGGVIGVIARAETAMTRVIERSYLKGVDNPGNLVDQVRIRNLDSPPTPVHPGPAA